MTEDRSAQEQTSTEDGEITCSYCGSANTRLERKRGPGLCRTVHYCRDCEQPFEQFS